MYKLFLLSIPGRKFFLITVFSIVSFMTVEAQVVKVDLNFDGRKEEEVHEPGYSSWVIGSTGQSTYTENGVTFKLVGQYGSSWYKAGVQSPYYARLANDGLVSQDVTLQISGLPAGEHSLLSFHNSFSNPESTTFSNIEIYVDGTLVQDDLQQTNRVSNNEDAATAFMEFEVEAGADVAIRFRSEPESSASSKSVHINGFELNTADASRQSSNPFPKDLDNHADADDGNILLQWKAAEGAKSHLLYIGLDEAEVMSATPESQAFIGELADTSYFLAIDNWAPYYWRVDENFGSDTVKGDVLMFKARHLAFEGAAGYGGFAEGGRGGKVVYVTNLNDDGPGSFRAAVTGDPEPRTVIFNVSGIIHLKSRIIMDDFLTIAGQTAPGKGVCFRGAPIGIGNESIVRFMRLRLGAGPTYDGMGMAGANHSILDHASISWTIDESFSSRSGKNITLQRTMLAEALNVAGHQNYPAGNAHGYAATIGGEIGSFHHNLLAHNEGRNWSLGGGLDGNNFYSGKLDIFNNVVYNWGGRATDGGAHEVNFVNNYYKKGPATTRNTILKADLEGTGKGSQSYYFSGNIVENRDGSLACDGTDNTCSRTYTTSGGQILDWEVFVDEPFFESEAEIQSARDAYKSVLSDVGCTMPMFDDHDKRIIQETLEGTYTYTGSKSGKKGLIDHQDDAGGYEDYPEMYRAEGYDSDLDGLPDWWEELFESNPDSPEDDFSDANADSDQDGYTNLEEYLMWMAQPIFTMKTDSMIVINLSKFTEGFTEEPVFEIVTDDNADVTIKNENEAHVTPGESGIGQFKFKVTDKAGSSMIRTIGLQISLNTGGTVDKVKEILVDTTALALREGENSIELEIGLSSAPEGNVVLDITSSQTKQISILPSALTFTPDNGHSTQNVTLTALDDSELDGDVLSTITISVNGSASKDYLETTSKSIEISILDNDVQVINSTKKPELSVYPNPIKDIFQINGDQPIREVLVYTMSGGLVNALTMNEGLSATVDMKDAPSGIYVLKVVGEKATQQVKIVK